MPLQDSCRAGGAPTGSCRASLAQLILFERATGRAPPRTGPSQGGAKPLRAVLQRLPVLLAPTYDAKGRPMSGQGRPNGGQWRPTGCQGEANVGQIDANERPNKASIMFCMKYTALRPGPGSPGGVLMVLWLHVIWFFKPLSRHRPTITDCSTDIRHQQIRWTKVLGSRVYVLVSRVYGFGSRV